MKVSMRDRLPVGDIPLFDHTRLASVFQRAVELFQS
jgi:hypothetical protein